MRLSSPRTLFALVAFVFAARAFALDAPLKFISLDERTSFTGQVIDIPFSTTPPVGYYKFPPANGVAFFARVKFRGDERVVMLDRRTPDDKMLNRVRIDLNADRDLTNDKPIDNAMENAGDNMSFLETGNIETAVDIGGKTIPYRFQLTLIEQNLSELPRFGTVSNPRNYISAILMSRCCYLAEFKIDGKPCEIAFTDYNLNGRFSDPPGDGFFRDQAGDFFFAPNGDRMFIRSGGSFDVNGELPLGKWLMIGGALFEIRPDFAAGKLTLTPAEGAATLALPPSIHALAMTREKSFETLVMFKPERQVKVPEGGWKLVSYQLERQDAQGDTWRLLARSNVMTPALKLEKNTSATLAIGEPFSPLVRVFPGGNGAEVMLMFAVVDKSNSQMTALSHIGNKTRIPLSRTDPTRPREPSWTAVTAEGEKVASGSFEYG